jgi:hypothetical protein
MTDNLKPKGTFAKLMSSTPTPPPSVTKENKDNKEAQAINDTTIPWYRGTKQP